MDCIGRFKAMETCKIVWEQLGKIHKATRWEITIAVEKSL